MRKTALAFLLTAIALVAHGQNNVELAEGVKASMNETLQDNPLFQNIDLYVEDVLLIHKSGNEYRGVATVVANGTASEVGVEVFADDEAFLWEADQDALGVVLLRAAIEASQQ